MKRADETVMFGNQQNLAHKSVKKSGPAPLDSKMAAKQEAVMAAQDPEQELPQGLLTAAEEDRLEEELRTLMQAQHEAAVAAEANAAEKAKKAEKKAVKKAVKKAEKKAVKKSERPAVELDLANADKRDHKDASKKPEKSRKDYEGES